MIVSADRSIELLDVALIQADARLLLHPILELDVGRAVGFDEIERFLAVQPEAIKHHLVVALTAAWVTGGELAARFERGFLPEAWQVNDAERAGCSRTN